MDERQLKAFQALPPSLSCRLIFLVVPPHRFRERSDSTRLRPEHIFPDCHGNQAVGYNDCRVKSPHLYQAAGVLGH